MASTYEDIKGEIVISVQMVAKPGAGDALAKWATDMKAHVDANEPGTLEYTVARYGDIFAVWQRYANADGLKAHLTNEVLESFKNKDLLAKVSSFSVQA
ncbi:hypothetical protein AcW1_006058 [Taiwanofungus camphoratus]|nr:hypothetical protein AcV5_006379 [Antrodia cinnamomea]KAI0957779.1 hypothetical protein AcW1_006058 [Antrodia cinnamomea]